MSNSDKIVDFDRERSKKHLYKALDAYVKCQIVQDRYGRAFRVDKNGHEIVDLGKPLRDEEEENGKEKD